MPEIDGIWMSHSSVVLHELRTEIHILLDALSRFELQHATTPRCNVYMPIDGRCSCGLDEFRKWLATHE